MFKKILFAGLVAIGLSGGNAIGQEAIVSEEKAIALGKRYGELFCFVIESGNSLSLEQVNTISTNMLVDELSNEDGQFLLELALRGEQNNEDLLVELNSRAKFEKVKTSCLRAFLNYGGDLTIKKRYTRQMCLVDLREQEIRTLESENEARQSLKPGADGMFSDMIDFLANTNKEMLELEREHCDSLY